MATKTPAVGIDLGTTGEIEISDNDMATYYAKHFYMKRFSNDETNNLPSFQYAVCGLYDSGYEISPSSIDDPFEEIIPTDFEDFQFLSRGQHLDIWTLESDDYLKRARSHLETFISELEAERLKELAASDSLDELAKVTLLDEIEHIDQMQKSGQASGMEQQMVVGGAEGMEMEGD